MKSGGDGGAGGTEDGSASVPGGPPQPLEWKFSQVFGERTAGEEVQEGIIFLSSESLLCCLPIRSLLGVSVLIRACFSCF